MFITLTQRDGRPLKLNPKHIVSMWPQTLTESVRPPGTCIETTIRLPDEDPWIVDESLDAIESKIAGARKNAMEVRARNLREKARDLDEELGSDAGSEVANALAYVLGEEDAEHCGILNMHADLFPAKAES